MNSIITKYSGLLFLIFVFIILFSILSSLPNSFYMKGQEYEREGFLAEPGQYPASENGPLLGDSFKYTGTKTVANNSSYTNWWRFPIFSLGSYTQITNNLRYRRNPDDGECVRPDFCQALYKDAQNKTNVSKPLPPAPSVDGQTRVNYYNTPYNLSPQRGYQH